MGEKKVGKPRLYKTNEELEKKVNEYFDSCFQPKLRYNSKKKYYEPVYDNKGNKIMEQVKPFTMSGLAYYLGMSRESLLNYEKRDEYFGTITRARQRVENYVEERLFDREGVNGAKFNLSNNFKGWKEKQESDVNLVAPKIELEIVNNENLEKELWHSEQI